jgi:hypothetical protein
MFRQITSCVESILRETQSAFIKFTPHISYHISNALVHIYGRILLIPRLCPKLLDGTGLKAIILSISLNNVALSAARASVTIPIHCGRQLIRVAHRTASMAFLTP